MEDLIKYFAQPDEADGIAEKIVKTERLFYFLFKIIQKVLLFADFEEKQNRLRALRSRQDLFQEEGVLNMILDTIDKFSEMEALPDFAGLIGEETQVIRFITY